MANFFEGLVGLFRVLNETVFFFSLFGGDLDEHLLVLVEDANGGFSSLSLDKKVARRRQEVLSSFLIVFLIFE